MRKTGCNGPLRSTVEIGRNSRSPSGASAAAPALPADYNQDGTVDAADYIVWRKGLGTTYTQNDFNIWRANFGQTAGTGLGATGSASAPATPEPASLALLLFAAASLFAHPRRRVAAKNRC